MGDIQFIKPCSKCKLPQLCSSDPLTSKFYVRSGIEAPTEPGHYNSQCKTCIKRHNKEAKHLPPDEPRTETEKLAISFFTQHGIFALPGKAFAVAHCDILCWGCIKVEVKHARLAYHRRLKTFVFHATPKQVERGYIADLVLLVCDHTPQYRTFHLFRADDPVFSLNGHIKRGLMFRPGATEALRVIDGNTVMLQAMMDEAQDNLSRLWDVFTAKNAALKASAS